jgi:hypothetical protein
VARLVSIDGEGNPNHEQRPQPRGDNRPKLGDGELELVGRRQRERARILALLLGAFVILLFLITIAKTGMNW